VCDADWGRLYLEKKQCTATGKVGGGSSFCESLVKEANMKVVENSVNDWKDRQFVRSIFTIASRRQWGINIR